MQVILLENIEGLGNKYDVKNVNDGYARNFLLPRKMAQIATKTALREIMKRKEMLEKERQKKINHLKEIAKKLEEIKLTFILKEGEKGKVFGSISKSDIIKALEDKDKELKEKSWEVKLERPLKTTGEHIIEINLGEGIKAKLKLLLQTSKNRQN